MQRLSVRRRVKSGGCGDKDFGFSLAGSGCCGCVCSGHGWVRAEFEHNDAEEEAGDDVE